MNAGLDYVRRKGEIDDAYGAFPDVRIEGRHLRMIQLAQRLFAAHPNLVEECRQIRGEHLGLLYKNFWKEKWDEGALNLTENGFRSGDAALPVEDFFREEVIQYLAQFTSAPGMIHSTVEVEAINRMVEGIVRAMNARIAAVESQAPGRYRTERFMQKLMGPIMGFKGFAPVPSMPASSAEDNAELHGIAGEAQRIAGRKTESLGCKVGGSVAP